jgi:predicted phage terminase large subunit-like protein
MSNGFDIIHSDGSEIDRDNEDIIVIEPQEGPQTDFVSHEADIVIYGGEAGGGKTWGLLLQPLHYLHIKGFEGVIFRRTTKQIFNPGGLWDTSQELYGLFDNADPRISNNQWRFFDNKKIISKITFAHLEHEKNKLDWQGSEIPYIGFDELTHFSKSQFLYMLSRNRSMSGIPGKIRGTCNPDPDSFVRELIDWWIAEDGYVIEERCGKTRWLIADKGEFYQYDTEQELLDDDNGRWATRIKTEAEKIHNAKLKKNPKITFEEVYEDAKKRFIKTITFIKASVEDNQKLLEINPEYLANLNSLDYIEYMRLRKGNWNVRAQAGMYFKKEMFEPIIPLPPEKVKKRYRYWDRAATVKSKKNPDPDWTVGLKMSVDFDNVFYVEDVIRFRGDPGTVEKKIKQTAKQDGIRTFIKIEQEPGSAGVGEVHHIIRKLAGYVVSADLKRKNTEQLIRPVSSQAKIGNIKIVEGPWNKKFLDEIESFPDVVHDDQVVAFRGAFDSLFNNKKAGVW